MNNMKNYCETTGELFNDMRLCLQTEQKNIHRKAKQEPSNGANVPFWSGFTTPVACRAHFVAPDEPGSCRDESGQRRIFR